MRSSQRRRPRSSAPEHPDSPSPYDGIAADYGWLYDEVEIRLGTMTPGVRAVLAQLPVGARVLDAACGVGVDSSALADRGFDVVAADGSAAMIAATRDRLADRADAVTILQSQWLDLPEHLPPDSFEAVLCLGNSIAHVSSADEMTATFEAFHLLLVPGGVLVLDTHHWEELMSLGDRTIVEHVNRPNATGERRFHWTWGQEASTCTIQFQLEVGVGDRSIERTFEVDLHPFTADQLRDRLRQAGFREVGLDVMEGEDRYTAVGRAGS